MKLELKNINKSFGDKQVLKDVNLIAESGKAVGILGRNGAGKTTTIRIVMDVFPADSGEVLIDGQKPKNLKVGYLPEERGLYPKKSIISQLIYFAELKGMKKSDAVKSIDYWLDRLEMTEYRNKRLDTLSKGNQQKIQLITAVDHNPDIVILDEPFSGLDPVNAIVLKDLVKELIANGKIVIFSSHQMNYVEEFCEEVIIIKEGKIVLNGDIKEIKRSFPREKIIISTTKIDDMIEYIDKNASNIVKRIEKTDDRIIINMNSVDQKADLFNIISDSKIDIDEFKVYEPSLNDIFVKYTEDIAV